MGTFVSDAEWAGANWAARRNQLLAFMYERARRAPADAVVVASDVAPALKITDGQAQELLFLAERKEGGLLRRAHGSLYRGWMLTTAGERAGRALSRSVGWDQLLSEVGL